MTTPTITFWFDFASTYSYPSAMRVAMLAEQAKIPLTWRPFLLGPIFQAQGLTDSPFNIYPEKGRYMWRDMERICEKQQLPFRRPVAFPQHSVQAGRIACCGQDQAWQADFIRAVYQANFANQQNIAETDVLITCLVKAGLSATEANTILQASLSDEGKKRLRTQTEAAIQLGIFGAPSFIVTTQNGDTEQHELFWGNDRLEDALAWAHVKQNQT